MYIQGMNIYGSYVRLNHGRKRKEDGKREGEKERKEHGYSRVAGSESSVKYWRILCSHRMKNPWASVRGRIDDYATAAHRFIDHRPIDAPRAIPTVSAVSFAAKSIFPASRSIRGTLPSVSFLPIFSCHATPLYCALLRYVPCQRKRGEREKERERERERGGGGGGVWVLDRRWVGGRGEVNVGLWRWREDRE